MSDEEDVITVEVTVMCQVDAVAVDLAENRAYEAVSDRLEDLHAFRNGPIRVQSVFAQRGPA